MKYLFWKYFIFSKHKLPFKIYILKILINHINKIFNINYINKINLNFKIHIYIIQNTLYIKFSLTIKLFLL